MNLLKDRLATIAFLLTCACAVAPIFSIAASQLLLGGAFATTLLARQKLRLPPIKLPLLLFILGTFISLALSPDPWSGRPQIRKFFVFLVLVCVASTIQRLRTVRIVFLYLVGAATLSALWGLVQFYNKYEAAQAAGREFYRYYIAQRMTGFMSHWMTFSGEMMMVLLLLLAFLMFSPERRKHLWLWFGCAAIISSALLLALTRGAWMGVGAGVLYLLWYWNKKTLLAVPVLAIAAFFAMPDTVQDRVTSSVRPRGDLDSNQHRIVTWRTGTEMIKAHPWFGLGPEQVGKQFHSYIPADISRPLPDGWYGHLHNFYLQFAAERGIPTMLMMLWLLGKVLFDFWRAANRAPAELSDTRFVLHGCIALVISVMVMGVVEHNLGDSEVLQMFLATIAMGYVAVENA